MSNQINNFYVYIYLNPLKPGNYNYGEFHFDYEPFYVGMGHNNRYLHHLNAALNNKIRDKNYHKLNTIKKILRSGISEKEFKRKFILKIQKNIIKFCAFSLEMLLIKLIGRKDLNLGPLLNLVDGGIGTINISEETRKKLSNAAKGQQSWCKGLTKETNDSLKRLGEKVSNTKKNWNETYKKEVIQKIVNSIKGKYKGKNNKNYLIELDNFSNDIIDLYVNKKITLKDISKIYDVAPKTIRRVLIANNIEIISNIRNLGNTGNKNKKYIDFKENINDIIYLYNNGESLYNIGLKYKVAKQTIKRVLKENNIHIRNESETKILKRLRKQTNV